MAIKNWKFECGGRVLDENTAFTPDIIQLTEDLGLPQNTLGYAKVMIMQLGFPTSVFHWEGFTVEVPSDKITTFNPFLRASAGGAGASVTGGSAFYMLDGQEFPFVDLKKNRIHSVSI